MANTNFVKIGGVDKVAEALTVIDQGTCKNILENLAMDDPELADEIGQSIRVVKTIQQMEKQGKITVNK